MSEDKELETWRTEWQALGGTRDLAEQLARRVVEDGRRIRRGVAVEVGAAVFGVVTCTWLVVRTRGELVATVACAGLLFFFGVWVTRLLTLRRGSLRALGSGVDEFVELTRRRLADDVAWNRFAHRSMQILTGLLVPWGIWAFVARYALYRAEPWRAVVGFGTAAVILAAVFVVNGRKRRKLEAERERFDAVVTEHTLA
jgi:hypothetical protein